jgi:hypothetical protein
MERPASVPLFIFPSFRAFLARRSDAEFDLSLLIEGQLATAGRLHEGSAIESIMQFADA